MYDVAAIIDAPEHHEYARSMGLLTWGTWDTKTRDFEERLKDFTQAYPPGAPTRFQGALLTRTADGEYRPADPRGRLERFLSPVTVFGSLVEVLARYGLRLRDGPPYVPSQLDVRSFREVARLRNQRLRRLHGAVDIEAEDMDEAKAAEIERREKKEAAEQVRRATAEMRRQAEETND